MCPILLLSFCLFDCCGEDTGGPQLAWNSVAVAHFKRLLPRFLEMRPEIVCTKSPPPTSPPYLPPPPLTPLYPPPPLPPPLPSARFARRGGQPPHPP